MSQHSAFAIARRSWFCPQSISKNGLLGFTEIPFRRAASEKKANGGIVASVLRSGLGCALALMVWVGAGSLCWTQSVFPLTPIGSATPPQVITVPVTTTGLVTSVQVLTMGATPLDFSASGAGGTCITSPSVTAPTTCTFSVTFNPEAPGVRMGAVELLGAGPTVLGTAYIYGTGKGGLGALRPSTIGSSAYVQIVAGNGRYTEPVIDPGPALSAELHLPSGIVWDGAGNLYISDTSHNLIRKVTFSGGVGTISTIAGDGNGGYAGGDNILASAAEVSLPGGLAVDGAGNLYIADTGNNVVRMISAATGIISRVAGNGTQGYNGDNIAATSAELNAPEGVAVDGSGNIWIADTGNNRIREVSAATGLISTVAGNGTGGYTVDGVAATASELNRPYAVAFGYATNWYIADAGNYRVRMVNAGNTISTVAGNGNPGTAGDGSVATSADLNAPSGLAVDPAGNIYIAARSGNQDSGIRKVTPGGIITSLAQNTTSLYQPVELDGPIGLSLDGNGNLFFADSLEMEVKEIPSNFAVLDFTLQGPIRQGQQSAALKQTVENIGNAALDITGYTLPASTPLPTTPPTAYAVPILNLSVNNAISTCTSVGVSLAADADCTYLVTFAPGISPRLPQNTTLVSDVDVADNTVASVAGSNTPLVIQTYGLAAPLTSTTITLPASPMRALFGATTPILATVTTGLGTGNLIGTVTFTDTFNNGAPTSTSESMGSTVSTTVETATSSFPISTLQVGVHSIVACYVPETTPLVENHFGSCTTDNGGTPLLLTIDENTTTQVTSVPATASALGQAVVFTATVSAPANSGQAPDGLVNFTTTTTSGGTTPLCSGVVLASTSVTNTMVATCSPPASLLIQGKNTITANYLIDASQLVNPSSNSLTLNVEAPSVVTFTSAPNPSNFGTPVTFTFTVAGTPAATGTVTFHNGPTTLGSSSIPKNGVWTFTTLASAPLPVGTSTITATYGGDANWAPATATLSQVVVPAVTTIAFVNPPATAEVEIPVSFTVQVSSNGSTPTGNVVFLDDGNPIGTVALAGGTATLTYTFTTTSATAPHSITATYGGDTNNAPPAVPITPDVINVTAIPTQTSLVQTSTSGANPTLILVASVVGVDLPTQFPPSGTVVFTNGAATLGSAQLVDGVATFQPSATGALNVIATYSPTLAPVDPLHLGSASTPLAVTNNGNGFTLNAAPPKLTISPTQNATVTLTIAPVNGFKDTVGLGCASLPPGMTCTFSSLTTVLDGTNPNTITLTIDTNNPLLGGATAMNKPQGNGRFTLASIFWPFSLLMGLVLWRFRKRSTLLRNALLILVFAGTAALVNGCGGIGKSAAVPGTYSIQVVGVGINSNISQYVPLTVVVTK